MKLLALFLGLTSPILFNSIIAQNISIHEQQLLEYNALGNSNASYYEAIPNNNLPIAIPKTDCNLNKVVYGWHPYWVGSAYTNYQWDLLSHFSFFSYEVNPSTGAANTTHGWSTSAAVDAALASGNTKVTLTATLFSSHTTFFSSSTAQQTLIDNLINLVSSRGAHGVNIDFEGIPSSQTTNFANFMVDLSNQMHAAIPGSEVSTVLYAVDWNNVFDFSIMEPAVDQYIIMGYGYYYTGSGNAGPTDPLYHFGSSYNYTLSKTITYYLDAGCPSDKLIMGLPFYGYEWPTSSTSIPSSTTGGGTSRTFAAVKNNSSGNYSAANHQYDDDSFTDVYVFNSGGTRQCFITEEDGFAERLKHINRTGIGGIGIWALGYDNGYTELWDAMRVNLTDCYEDPCSGQIWDFGGPTKNYYNNEDYTWTIQPPGATELAIDFSMFDIELNYDYLYIYDGNSTSATQIPGSPFTGTSSPGSFTTSTGAVTFRFTSDGATVDPGFLATYSCNIDNEDPTTYILVGDEWQTQDFSVDYIDNDNVAVNSSYSLITEIESGQQSANSDLGYVYSDFSDDLSTAWNSSTGTWLATTNNYQQTDESLTNAASYFSVNQQNDGSYLYNWKGKIEGTGSNRRAGLHFFVSDPTLPNGGNSYLVYWRVDTDKCQIYRCDADVINIQTNDDVIVDAGVEYDFKITFDPSTGVIEAYLNNILSSSWTDVSPHLSGNAVIQRAGNCKYTIDDVKIFKERATSEVVTVGTLGDHIIAQNDGPLNPAVEVFTIVIDDNSNFSAETSLLTNVDYTVPVMGSINDGLGTDITYFVTPSELSANWTASNDIHSGIVEYHYAIGTSSGATDVRNWTSVGLATSVTATGLSLSFGQIYYVSIKAINGAGLEAIITSNGQTLQSASTPPIANYTVSSSIVCEGDSIQLINTSTDGETYNWSSTTGTFSDPSAQNPYYTPLMSGTQTITLEASNSAGTADITLNYSVTISEGPTAIINPDNTLVGLPNAIVQFENESTNADSYFWDFGDGVVSTDASPWHQFTTTGTYEVMLVAMSDGCTNDTSYVSITVGHVGINEIENDYVLIYPNPFVSDFKIVVLQNMRMKLYDLKGRLIQDRRLVAGENKIELAEDFPSGVYFVQLSNKDISKTIRIVKN